jgi:hypothetical protein
MEVYPRVLLTSEIDGGVWSASRPGQFSSCKYLVTRWMEGWMDPSASLEAVAKIEYLFPASAGN